MTQQSKQKKEEVQPETKEPAKKPNFGGTLTLSGIKPKKK